MAISKCGKCNGSYFQVVEKEPSGSNVKIMFVQCTSCGVPVGTMDYFSVGRMVSRMEDRLKSLEKAVGGIDRNVRTIGQMLNSLRR